MKLSILGPLSMIGDEELNIYEEFKRRIEMENLYIDDQDRRHA